MGQDVGRVLARGPRRVDRYRRGTRATSATFTGPSAFGCCARSSTPYWAILRRARQFERFILSLRPDDLLAAEPQLARLTVPTLIVWATQDMFFDLSWAYWLKSAPLGRTGGRRRSR